MRAFLLFLIIGGLTIQSRCQTAQETPAPAFIRTIIFQGDTPENQTNPVTRLGSYLRLSFDDIIGDEADYYYTIDHYNFDWTPSQLSKNEFLEGFDNVRIINYTNALNTLQPYTHYELSIPNNNVKGLKVSGNYLLSIYNSNRELVFSRKFMVYEPLARVSAEVRRSRDLTYIDEKQTVNFSIDSPDLLLKNPAQNVKVSLVQNNDLKRAIHNLEPQYTIANELIYRYDEQSSFWGGNEFLQFDNKDLRVTTADIASVELNELYHHYLFLDFTRNDQPYTYNPDINGGFVVRSILAQNSDIEADYIWVHFRLKNYDVLENKEIHLYGGFNNFELDQSTLMAYNEETGYYEGARLFKQGYYNYRYIVLNEDGSIDDGYISGNFDETENLYSILVYYRTPGARYDRMIGVGYANSINIRN
ncbi:DUF5103 domain-containing protein [Christiangramia sabulilitoris]|uniref:DUF5103 domain-containing protein n=1 Tax=Christiangramia sabulilitoris TaxID=2583991 RepID=A0A550HZA9_9FLAO|nr:DUF5103 domain-containing protein [Christiangramia sabulilitoris]TRO64040.1 DUF5103 domain-containing protein [Christiangramia sabulilitoris]